MFNIENVRNKIKVLLKISYNLESYEYKISKLSPIVSQYGVEDTNLLDSVVNFRLDPLLSDLINPNLLKVEEFYLPILIVLFRDETETEFFFTSFTTRINKIFLDKKFKFNNYFFFY